ncbi:MAG: sulfotransferase domain-containing protein [Candidatus Omnitrophota bacterium]
MLQSWLPPLASKRKLNEIKTVRKKIRKQSPDQFALNCVNSTFPKLNYKQEYQHYIKLKMKPNVLLLKYENIVVNFENELRKILNFFNLDVSQDIIKNILKNANFNVEKENIYSHKRRVTPGDHKEKLNQETITCLNKFYSQILNKLEYFAG